VKVWRKYVHARDHRRAYALAISVDSCCGWLDVTIGRRSWWLEVEW
jgi:hypothetical protein